ncbi:acyl-CoA dehydrogenase [Ramlibacter sp.]|uniref:acyl-CoA dehydrogenase n=1 Tax=Ramlibacter sp. TaxID=1917967 RepID=UPI003D09ECC2
MTSTAFGRADDDVVRQVRDSAADYLEGRGGLAVPRKQRTWPASAPRVAEFSRDEWRRMAELGWTGILVDESHGGTALGLAAAAAVAAEIGRWVAPEPFTAVAGIAATLLAGSDVPLAADLRKRIAGGEAIVGIALGEHARDVYEPQCKLARSGALSGEKKFCTPVDPVDGWIATVRDEDGRVALVYLDAADVAGRMHRQPAADGRQLGTLKLDGLKVGDGAVLLRGAEAESALRRAVAAGHLLHAAELGGAAQRVHELTLDHIRTRTQFGKPLGAFQVLQHRCVDVRIQLELAQASLARAVREGDALGDGAADAARFESCATRARMRAAKCAMAASQTAVQLYGAMGYTDECDVGLFFKRTVTLMGRLGSHGELRKRWTALEAQGEARPETAAKWQGEFPRNADWTAMPEAEFRAMARAFLEAHYPARLRHLAHRPGWHEVKEWFHILSKQGWIAPLWPPAHGGMGLPPDKMLAWVEELEEYGAAPLPNQSLIMLGPLLLKHGTDAQREKYLPKILKGEHVWCQGYSEPNAGSDLASLRTQAVVDGGHFVVNGQKIWTTNAHEATHIFMLVRTNKNVKPQAGISFLLCELDTPGVTVRPIRNLAGMEEFCEVFFDNVRVPVENIVGGLDKGWEVAKALLGHERINQGSPKFPQAALNHYRKMADGLGLSGDAEFEGLHADFAIDLADLGDLYSHYAEFVKRGEQLPASVSILKVWGTETFQRIGAAIAQHAGEYAGLEGEVDVGGEPLSVLMPLWNAVPASLYGGTSEVHRNILAKAVLELPS